MLATSSVNSSGSTHSACWSQLTAADHQAAHKSALTHIEPCTACSVILGHEPPGSGCISCASVGSDKVGSSRCTARLLCRCSSAAAHVTVPPSSCCHCCCCPQYGNPRTRCWTTAVTLTLQLMYCCCTAYTAAAATGITRRGLYLPLSTASFTHRRACTAQHSTAQHSTAQHSTAQHSTAQHSTAQHSTAAATIAATLGGCCLITTCKDNNTAPPAPPAHSTLQGTRGAFMHMDCALSAHKPPLPPSHPTCGASLLAPAQKVRNAMLAQLLLGH
jgi:hypothetical protein